MRQQRRGAGPAPSGWTIDVHAMRHSSIDLTVNVYTDPQLLDVAGALERLPKLPIATPLGGPAHMRRVAL